MRRLALGLLTILLTFATMAPATAQKIRPRYIGVVAPGVSSEVPKADVGSISLMSSSYWIHLERRPGRWDFSQLDAQVAAAKGHGAKAMLVLGFSPRFHSTRPRSATPHTAMPRMRAWKRYVRKVVRRYGDRIDYQVWPEPSIIGNWTGTHAQLARLQRAAHTIIKARAPRATVAGPAMVLRLPYQEKWAREFWSQRPGGTPVGHFIDVNALDPYPLKAGEPEDAMRIVQKGRRIARQYGGVRKPVWAVEINYNITQGGPTDGSQLTHRRQIAYLMRTYLLFARIGVKRTYWLGWGNYSSMGISLVRRDGVTATPAGRALDRISTWMVGYNHRGCTRSRAGVWKCVLKGVTDGRQERRVIVWREKGTSKFRVPARTFLMQRGNGGTKVVQPGDRVRVTIQPTMFRAYRGRTPVSS